LGRSALALVDTGSDNIGIGDLVGDDIVGGGNNILIGNGLDAGGASVDNLIVIGSLGSSHAGQKVIVDPNLDLVAIGSSNPGNWPTLTGLDNTVVGDTALNSVTTGANNTAYGSRALSALTLGTGNVALGVTAGVSIIDGVNNTLVGSNSGDLITSGDVNVCVGINAGDTITTGNRNVIVGSDLDVPASSSSDIIALGSLSSGHSGQLMVVDPGLQGIFIGIGKPGNWPDLTGLNNHVIGDQAGDELTTGAANTMFGNNAGTSLTTGNSNVFIGSAVGDALVDGTENTAVGNVALTNQTTSDHNTAVGSFAGDTITTGARNILLGRGANPSSSTSNNQIVIRCNVAGDAGQMIIVDPSLSGVFMGAGDPGNWPTLTGLANVAIGDSSLGALTTGAENTGLGNNAGFLISSGSSNTAIGAGALSALTSGTNNTVLGRNAGNELTGSFNTAIGAVSQTGSSGVSTANSNTSVGYLTLNAVTTGASNAILGASSGDLITTGGGNTIIGQGSARALVGGSDNTIIGQLCAITQPSAAGNRNTIIGNEVDLSSDANDVIVIAARSAGNAGQIILVDPGNDNVFMGSNNPGNWPNLSGTDNVAIGNATGDAITTGSNNTLVGSDLASSLNSGNNNTLVGSQSLTGLTSGSSNVVVGNGAATSLVAGLRNVVIGPSLDPGSDTNDLIAIGSTSGNNQVVVVDSTGQNVFIGSGPSTSPGNWGTSTGGTNTALGYSTLSALTDGASNVALGASTLLAVTSGDDNIAIGRNSSGAITTGNRNIWIGGSTVSGTLATGNDNTLIGFGIDTPAAGTSNFLNIEDTLFGSTSSTPRLRIGGTGAVSAPNNGGLDLNDLDVVNIRTRSYGAAPTSASSSAGVLDLDLRDSSFFTVTLTENITDLNFTFDYPGIGEFYLKFVQDATGGWTVTGWDTNVDWPGGSAPTISSGVNDEDLLRFVYDGTTYYGTIAQDFS